MSLDSVLVFLKKGVKILPKDASTEKVIYIEDAETTPIHEEVDSRPAD